MKTYYLFTEWAEIIHYNEVKIFNQISDAVEDGKISHIKINDDNIKN